MSFKLVMSRGRLAERESVRFVKCLVKGLGFDLADVAFLRFKNLHNAQP